MNSSSASGSNCSPKLKDAQGRNVSRFFLEIAVVGVETRARRKVSTAPSNAYVTINEDGDWSRAGSLDENVKKQLRALFPFLPRRLPAAVIEDKSNKRDHSLVH